jgi:MFS family permease
VTRRPLVALFVADAVSMTGNVMALAAIPWFVLVTTGSAAQTGLVAAANLVPIVLANLLGGAVVDRLGFRRASIVADLASGASVAAIPLLHLTVGIELWQLVVLVFLGALLDAPGTNARYALLPEAAAAAGWSLERANGVHAAVERGSRLAGAPVAGVLIAAVGATNVLWIDAATFAVSATVIRLGVPAAARAARVAASYLDDLREGFRFLLGERVLLTIALTVAVTNFLDSMSIVLLPVVADEVYDTPVMLGLMTGAVGAGSVVSALAFASVGHRLPRRAVYAGCFMGITLWYPIVATFPHPIVAIAGLALCGLSSGPLNPLIGTVELERTPHHMRARVFGAIGGLAWMAMPLGVLVGGAAVDLAGLRPTLLAVGGVYLAFTALLWFLPGVRELDVRPGVADESRPEPSPAVTRPGAAAAGDADGYPVRAGSAGDTTGSGGRT